jgi:hypothetical protein
LDIYEWKRRFDTCLENSKPRFYEYEDSESNNCNILSHLHLHKPILSINKIIDENYYNDFVAKDVNCQQNFIYNQFQPELKENIAPNKSNHIHTLFFDVGKLPFNPDENPYKNSYEFYSNIVKLNNAPEFKDSKKIIELLPITPPGIVALQANTAHGFFTPKETDKNFNDTLATNQITTSLSSLSASG